MDTKELKEKTINLGHGSGGLMTRDLLDKVIFSTFDNPLLNKKHDGSIVKFESKEKCCQRGCSHSIDF